MTPTNLITFTKNTSIASDPRLQLAFSDILHALIKTKSCLLSEWARCHLSFAAFIKKVSRLLQNKNCSWKLEGKILSWVLPRFIHKKYIPVAIDPTFVPNKYMGTYAKTHKEQIKATKGFFIFSASIPLKGRAISFFHACYRNTQLQHRVYNSINTLFGNQLVKLSSLLHDYAAKAVFIMDRGFGYEFFINKMNVLKNHYVIRARDMKTNITLVSSNKKYTINQLADIVTKLNEHIHFKVLYKNKVQTNLVITKAFIRNKICTWVLLTDLDNPDDVLNLYKQRMKIEETFKDWKSTGFNIEKLQIRLWDILPKVIWSIVLAHFLLYCIGEFIALSKRYQSYFKSFIQIKKNLSYVQLAWKAYLHDPDELEHILFSLFINLFTKRSALC